MTPSQLETYTLPSVGPGTAPNAIAHATSTPMRVVVRNVGPVVLFLGIASADVAGAGTPTSKSYQLPVGASDVFVLAPRQAIYASAAGPGSRVSVATSEALPIDLKL